MKKLTFNLGTQWGLPAFREGGEDEDWSYDIPPVDGYYVCWGPDWQRKPDLYMESGFFRGACWVDKLGIYADSSLTSPEAIKAIEKFNPPEDIIDLVLESDMQSKYKQSGEDAFSSHVLALQFPTDMAVLSVGSSIDYMRKMDEIMERFGNQLFVKIHPNMKDLKTIAKFERMAKKHGCFYGNYNLSVLDHCKSVHVYNSSIVVDAWMRGRETFQYAPGTFSNVPRKRKTVNFLMWKYCLPVDLTREQWIKIFEIYKNSDELFPLPMEYSWGHWFLNKITRGE